MLEIELDTPLFRLQRRLLEDHELRDKFNIEWRERMAILLANGSSKSEAITTAIKETKEKWLR